MTEFADRVAIVTGAVHGIGRAVVDQLTAEGARVGVIDIDDAAAGDLPEGVMFVRASVDDAEAVEEAVDAIAAHFGRLDIMHANAGIDSMERRGHELPVEEWRRVLGINLDGIYYACRAAIPHMLAAGGGAIVCTSSIHSKMTHSGAIVYATAKGGINAMVRALALDYADDNIRVNAVLPGAVETQLLKRLRETAADPDAFMAAATSLQAIGRVGRPEEIAELVCFLASDRASFITGTEMPADGGALARMTSLERMS